MDAGDFLGGSDEQAALRTRYLLTCMARCGQDAVALGEMDLSRGTSYPLSVTDSLHIPLLCANVRDQKSGKLIARPYAIRRIGARHWGPLEIGGYKIGIFGVMGGELIPPPRVDREHPFVVEDPVSAARGVVSELRGKEGCRMVIALAHLGPEGARDLVQEVEGIDLVVSGHGGSKIREPERFGSSLHVRTGDLGAELGHLVYNIGPQGPPILERTEVGFLDSSVPEDPDMAVLMEEHEKDLARILRDPQEMPEDLVTADKVFLGTDGCTPCHEEIVRSWRETAHAHAFASLEATGDDVNLDCVRCHTTGYRTANGFRHKKWTPQFTDVQCEECHGPGARHVARVEKSTGEEASPERPEFRPITPATCTRCHRGDDDPDFDYERDLRIIRHP